MESVNFLSMTAILFAIFLMGAHCMSLLSEKWKSYFVGILLFKLLITYLNSRYPGLLPLPGVDGWGFASQAQDLLARSSGIIGIFQDEQTLFVKEVALVFYIFGVSHFYMYFLVCFGSLIAFKYMILLAKEITENDELAQKIGLLYLVWPILLMHASSFLRENQCQLLCILSFYNFVRYVKKHNQVHFACAIFWSIIAAMTHSGMIALTVCFCIIGSMVDRSGKVKLSPAKMVFGFILLLALMSSPFAGGMTEKFEGAENAESVEELTAIVSRQSAEAGSMYIASTPSNPIKLLLLEPYLFLMFVFSPFPFQIHSVGQGIAFIIESIPQFLLVRAVFIYLVLEREKGSVQIKSLKTVTLWTVLLFYFIFSLGTTTFGTAMRHRAKIAPLMIVFASMYYAERKGVVFGTKNDEDEEIPGGIWETGSKAPVRRSGNDVLWTRFLQRITSQRAFPKGAPALPQKVKSPYKTGLRYNNNQKGARPFPGSSILRRPSVNLPNGRRPYAVPFRGFGAFPNSILQKLRSQGVGSGLLPSLSQSTKFGTIKRNFGKLLPRSFQKKFAFSTSGVFNGRQNRGFPPAMQWKTPTMRRSSPLFKPPFGSPTQPVRREQFKPTFKMFSIPPVGYQHFVRWQKNNEEK